MNNAEMEDLFGLWKRQLLDELRDRELKARRTANGAKAGGDLRRHCDHAAEMYSAAYEAAKSVKMAK